MSKIRKSKKFLYILETGVIHFSFLFCVVTALFFIMAYFEGNNGKEANVGTFSADDFNDGWRLEFDGRNEIITLPTTVDASYGDEIIISNTLPDYVGYGMNLMLRASIEEVYVYIDGELREKYSVDNYEKMTEYLPSVYLVTALSDMDAGKTVKIVYTIKNSGILNGVTLSYGNNAWFRIIKKSMPLAMLACVLILLGLLVIIIFFFVKNKHIVNRSILYIGMLMSMVGIWMLSESKFRQLFMKNVSLVSYFAFFSIEITGVLAVMYFDEVQHRIYHKIYVIIGALMSLQIMINILLNATGVMPIFRSVVFSHMWLVIGALVSVANIIRDIKSRAVKKYPFVAIGMTFFLIMSLCEIANFYIISQSVFGTFLSVGLMFLLVATCVQSIADSLVSVAKRERKQQESWIRTIETIASAIDAKDEYTGGHSNRVGEYASILAREMAADYDFSEEDILRIRYIGLMHDIGKIGVADSILNKVGRLTDEEFRLMKHHVVMGADLLKAMDSNMEELISGVKYHHERFDGMGYPEGLEGTDIPLVARILCLADSYDAMTSNRVYRHRLSDEEVRAEIIRCAGTQFDPALAEIFVSIIDRGDLKPNTINGMEIGSDGNVMKSSLLEARLLKDLKTEGVCIRNSSHVRMVSYIIKLAEYKKRRFAIYLAYKTEKNSLDDILKPYIRTMDICVGYDDNSNLVVFFDRSDSEMKETINSLNKDVHMVKLEE